jgi:hypothetical protein
LNKAAFPQKRESTLIQNAIEEKTKWIPALAGMTAIGAAGSDLP